MFKEPIVKTVTNIKYKTVTKTVVEEKIIYKDKECKKEVINEPEIIKEKVKEYVIASTSDSRYKYTISLFSYFEPIRVKSFEKIVLNGKMKINDYEGIFIMDVNQKILENLSDVYFKIIDNETQKVYINHNPCLYNTITNFIYKVDLDISGDEIMCMAYEDRELKGKAKNQIFWKKLNNNKSTFLKMDNNEIKPSP